MKFLNVMVLIILAVSFLPLDGFCEDHMAAEDHHCIVACHSCHQMVSPEATLEAFSNEHASHIFLNHAFHYQTPVLDQTHRPPIVTS